MEQFPLRKPLRIRAFHMRMRKMGLATWRGFLLARPCPDPVLRVAFKGIHAARFRSLFFVQVVITKPLHAFGHMH
ncbi:hypothetical protein ATC00_25165 [Sinorhizobium americanum]|nr:hypothetical protein ATC00_25165 [Sinorhizobium americanum]